MNKRLEKLFAESRERHSKKKVQETNITDLKEKRAKRLVYSYRGLDKGKFDEETDLDYKWIINNIFNSKCEYCGEDNWEELGCDRIDNTKPHTKDNCICACKRCNIVRGDKFTVDEMKEIGETIKRIEKRNTVFKVAKRKGKQVAKVDKDGNIIKVYPSMVEASVDGYERSCIGKACRSYKEKNGYDRQIYKGYYWRYI